MSCIWLSLPRFLIIVGIRYNSSSCRCSRSRIAFQQQVFTVGYELFYNELSILNKNSSNMK